MLISISLREYIKLTLIRNDFLYTMSTIFFLSNIKWNET